MRGILAVAAVSAAMVTGLGVGTASAASVGTCDGGKAVVINSYGHTIRQPVHTGTGSRNCELSRGNSGAGVRHLQIALRGCNSASGLEADGIFGPQTEAVLEKAQARLGVGVDGIYGPETRKVLGWPVHDANGKPNGKCARYTS